MKVPHWFAIVAGAGIAVATVILTGGASVPGWLIAGATVAKTVLQLFTDKPGAAS